MSDIKLTVQKALEAHVALTILVDSDKRNKFIFPSSVRIRLAANIRKTKPIAEEFEAERGALVKDLGEITDKVKQTITVKPENQAAFAAQLKSMQEEVTDIEFKPITQAELFGVTPEQEAAGAKANQIEIDLINVLEDTGLLK